MKRGVDGEGIQACFRLPIRERGVLCNELPFPPGRATRRHWETHMNSPLLYQLWGEGGSKRHFGHFTQEFPSYNTPSTSPFIPSRPMFMFSNDDLSILQGFRGQGKMFALLSNHKWNGHNLYADRRIMLNKELPKK